MSIAHSHLIFLKNKRLPTTINKLSAMTTGYPHTLLSSGINRKFIPYQPAIRVRGMKIVVTIVSTVMIRFCLISRCDLYISRS